MFKYYNALIKYSIFRYIGVVENEIPNGLGLYHYSDSKLDMGFYKVIFQNKILKKNYFIKIFCGLARIVELFWKIEFLKWLRLNNIFLLN